LGKEPKVKAQPYRIYFRPYLQFLIVLPLLFTASLLVLVALAERDRENLNLIPPVILLFALAYFARRATLSWLRISEDGKEIVKVPSGFEHRIIGERRRVKEVPAGSELLFCRQFGYGALNGYSIVLSAPNGARTVLWSAARGVSRRWWARVAEEIQLRFPLKTRLVTQTLSTDGMQETEWTAESDRFHWRHFLTVIPFAFSPFLGILVRYFTAKPLPIVMLGALLWISGSTVAWRLSRSPHRREGSSVAITLVAWTMEFWIFYLSLVLVAGALIDR
jgi:hypothetical protein